MDKLDIAINLITDLLDSGDDTGCDGLIVVGRDEYMKLRQAVGEATGQWLGMVEES